MESFPQPYVEHNLPLVLLSGLGGVDESKQQYDQLRRTESGARITAESPECRGDRAQQMLNEFKAWDGTECAWNSTALGGAPGNTRYCIKAIGRAYTLPARKAAPLPQSPGAGGSPPPRNTELHSPLSPLSPGSPVFPDGIFTPYWMWKHQRQVPTLFLAFFNINDGQSSSQDEQLKTDINAIRSALTRSGYRTRFAVVLISDKSILHAPELEERMASVRRATALDSKIGLFFNPPMSSQAEVSTFVQTILVALYPSCMEYYRDLTKHARRKKSRGGPSPQAQSPIGGASQSTSVYGWDVRYEVKQGIFAEFRQEMDLAEKHYSGAIEELFSSEGGILETTNSWSPRWDEARLICDALAIRVLRCLLWNQQTTAAAHLWYTYKLRMKDLVDRRGKGSITYGWHAWEGRWSNIMAQLIQRADIPSIKQLSQEEGEQNKSAQVYAIPEKGSVQGDRLPPFNYLHHPGYFLRLFADGIRARWEKALAMSEDDRVPPDRSPASSVANRTKIYDLYLVPEPHEELPLSGASIYDHAAELEIASLLAATEFEARRQLRAGEQIRLELADDMVRAGRYVEAGRLLAQLWEQSSWREDRWGTPFNRLLTLLRKCLDQNKTTENAALVPALTWELLGVPSTSNSENELDMSRCLDDWDIVERIELHLHDNHRLSPISSTFTFKGRETHVGEPVECQLALIHNAFPRTNPIKISSVSFRLGTRVIIIRDVGTISTRKHSVETCHASQTSEASDGTLETKANLTLHPAQMRVLHIVFFPKEAQILELSGLAYKIENSKFILTHEFSGNVITPGNCWYLEEKGEFKTALLPHMDTKSTNVLPKPPKVQIHLRGLRKQYYTDEQVSVVAELVNEEAEAVSAGLSATVTVANGSNIPIEWARSKDAATLHSLGNMPAGTIELAELVFQGPLDAEPYSLMLDLRYTLLSDPDTPLMKTVTVEIPFIKPFQAKFTFSPQLYPGPWPSYFDPGTCKDGENEHGIPQRWGLGARIVSLVEPALKIEELELEVDDVQGDATCNIHSDVAVMIPALSQNKNVSGAFELETRKISLEDRRPSHLDLTLVVKWSPPEHSVDASATPSKGAITRIPVPRLTLPTSEPRVLCTATSNASGSHATLQYYLENPSVHFLTFALTMEASNDFAFTGPKHRALSVAPLSRHVIEYDLLLHRESSDDDENGRWISPDLQIVDSYYQKKLLIHPGNEGTRLDTKSGEILVWVGSNSAKLGGNIESR